MNREKLEQAAISAAGTCLKEKGYIAMVDVFIAMRVLAREDYERWRFRQTPYLERAMRGTLRKIRLVIRAVDENSRRGNLRPSWTAYMSWGKGSRVPVQFSASGDPNLERAYSTHWLRPKPPAAESAPRD